MQKGREKPGSAIDIEPRWRGVRWFVLAALAVLVAVGMLVTEVHLHDSSPNDGELAPGCGTVLAAGGEETKLCEAARDDRGSMVLAVLAVAGFLVAAGVRRRFVEHDRTTVAFGLFAVAAVLLLWPQTVEEDGFARCGAPLLRTSDEILDADEDHEALAECGVDRSKRLSWVLVWSVAGTLVVASRPSETL